MKKLLAISFMVVFSITAVAPDAMAKDEPEQVPIGKILQNLPIPGSIGTWQLFQCDGGAVVDYVDLPLHERGYSINFVKAAQLISAVNGAVVKFDEPDPRRSKFSLLQIKVKGDKVDLGEIHLGLCFRDNNNNIFQYRTRLKDLFLQRLDNGWYTSFILRANVKNNIVSSGNAVLRSVTFTRFNSGPQQVLLGEIMAESEGVGKERGYARTLITDTGACEIGRSCPK